MSRSVKFDPSKFKAVGDDIESDSGSSGSDETDSYDSGSSTNSQKGGWKSFFSDNIYIIGTLIIVIIVILVVIWLFTVRPHQELASINAAKNKIANAATAHLPPIPPAPGPAASPPTAPAPPPDVATTTGPPTPAEIRAQRLAELHQRQAENSTTTLPAARVTELPDTPPTPSPQSLNRREPPPAPAPAPAPENHNYVRADETVVNIPPETSAYDAYATYETP